MSLRSDIITSGEKVFLERAQGEHSGRRGGMADAEDLKSSGGEPPCGFDSHRRYCDRKRPDTPTPAIPKGSVRGRSTDGEGLSRQQPPRSAPIRPQTATQNATRPLLGDEELAAVCAAWPTLPEPIKAAILALVRAAGRDTP